MFEQVVDLLRRADVYGTTKRSRIVPIVDVTYGV